MSDIKAKIIYVGTEAEVIKFVEPLSRLLPVEIESAESVINNPRKDIVYFFYNEYFDRFRECIKFLVKHNYPSVYAIDGILEWRNSWEFPEGESCRWTMRPVLSHKIACIGNSQARILESWGNQGKCEIIGIPRLDNKASVSSNNNVNKFTILVCTANTPGYTDEQIQNTVASLKDLNAWCIKNKVIKNKEIRIIWRVTSNLEKQLKINGEKSNYKTEDLTDILREVNAVVTTPSTVLLEAMLQNIPVAILDYNNRPYYVPAAWTITSKGQFDQAIPELLDPPEPKVLYQNYILDDSLKYDGLASERTVELVNRMLSISQLCNTNKIPLSFPDRILQQENYTSHANDKYFNYKKLFPNNPYLVEQDTKKLQIIAEDLRVKSEKNKLTVDQAQMYKDENIKMTRVLNHPIVKIIVYVLKVIKRDKSFGKFD